MEDDGGGRVMPPKDAGVGIIHDEISGISKQPGDHSVLDGRVVGESANMLVFNHATVQRLANGQLDVVTMDLIADFAELRDSSGTKLFEELEGSSRKLRLFFQELRPAKAASGDKSIVQEPVIVEVAQPVPQHEPQPVQQPAEKPVSGENCPISVRGSVCEGNADAVVSSSAEALDESSFDATPITTTAALPPEAKSSPPSEEPFIADDSSKRSVPGAKIATTELGAKVPLPLEFSSAAEPAVDRTSEQPTATPQSQDHESVTPTTAAVVSTPDLSPTTVPTETATETTTIASAPWDPTTSLAAETPPLVLPKDDELMVITDVLEDEGLECRSDDEWVNISHHGSTSADDAETLTVSEKLAVRSPLMTTYARANRLWNELSESKRRKVERRLVEAAKGLLQNVAPPCTADSPTNAGGLFTSGFDWNKLPSALKTIYDKQGHRQEIIDGDTFWRFLKRCTASRDDEEDATNFQLPGRRLSVDDEGEDDDAEQEVPPEPTQPLSLKMYESSKEVLRKFLVANLISSGAVIAQTSSTKSQGAENGSEGDKNENEVGESESEGDEGSEAGESEREGDEGGEGGAAESVPPMSEAERLAIFEWQAKKDIDNLSAVLAGQDPQGVGQDEVMQIFARLGPEGFAHLDAIFREFAMAMNNPELRREREMADLIEERRQDPDKRHLADLWEKLLEAGKKEAAFCAEEIEESGGFLAIRKHWRAWRRKRQLAA